MQQNGEPNLTELKIKRGDKERKEIRRDGGKEGKRERNSSVCMCV